MSVAQLTWTDPTARTDNAALAPTDIASIDIFDDLGDGNGAQKIGTLTGAATSFVTPVLSVGAHRFTNVVNDTSGHSSAPSNVVVVNVVATLAPPAAVSDLAATLV